MGAPKRQWKSASVLLLLVQKCVSKRNLWPEGFTRLVWHATTTSSDGHWLYIDGGEIWNDTDATFSVLANTVILNLWENWTNDTLELSGVMSKWHEDNFRYARGPALWTDPDEQRIYSFGGIDYTTICGGTCPGWQHYDGYSTLHGPTGNDSDSGYVAMFPIGLDGLEEFNNFSNIDYRIVPPVFDAYGTAVGGNYHNFGGFNVSCGQLPEITNGLRNLYEFNTEPVHWTQNPLGVDISVTGGAAVSVPMFGDEGVILFIGGQYDSSGTSGVGAGPDEHISWIPMSSVFVLDIATGRTFVQWTSGIGPIVRQRFCAVGTADSKGHYDIFVFGGERGSNYDPSVYETNLTQVLILSVPEFHWTVANSDSLPRAAHTCNIFNNNEVIVIGGYNPEYAGDAKTDPDPWPNAVGVYDMSKLHWSNRHDSQPQSYTRNSLLASIPPNQQWASPEAAALFRPRKVPSNDSASMVDDQAQEATHQKGVKAGAIVGAICLLTIMLASLYWIQKRRAKPQKPVHPDIQYRGLDWQDPVTAPNSVALQRSDTFRGCQHESVNAPPPYTR